MKIFDWTVIATIIALSIDQVPGYSGMPFVWLCFVLLLLSMAQNWKR